MAIVIIYTMGRVGTNTINNCLDHGKNEVISLHSMRPRHSLDDIPREPLGRIKKKIKRVREIVETGQKAVVVSSVRDPISRALSAYCFFHEHWGTLKVKGPMDNVRKHFMETYNHMWALYFFDREIKEHLGIDIYGEQPKNHKDITIVKGNLTLVTMRIDQISNLLRGRLDSLGVKTNRPVKSSHGMKNATKGLYNRMQKIKFSEEYVNEIYDSKFAKFFFTEQERVNKKLKWGE